MKLWIKGLKAHFFLQGLQWPVWVVLHTTCTYHVHGVEISFSCSWTAATFHPQGWACNSLNWRYATAGLSKRLALLILGGRLRVLPSLTHIYIYIASISYKSQGFVIPKSVTPNQVLKFILSTCGAVHNRYVMDGVVWLPMAECFNLFL